MRTTSVDIKQVAILANALRDYGVDFHMAPELQDWPPSKIVEHAAYLDQELADKLEELLGYNDATD